MNESPLIQVMTCTLTGDKSVLDAMLIRMFGARCYLSMINQIELNEQSTNESINQMINERI